jgi:hypothetical protein
VVAANGPREATDRYEDLFVERVRRDAHLDSKFTVPTEASEEQRPGMRRKELDGLGFAQPHRRALRRLVTLRAFAPTSIHRDSRANVFSISSVCPAG